MARQLLQTLFVTEADILPDKAKKQLRIRVHSTSRPASNKAIEKLFEQLNQTEFNYPGTDLRLIYGVVIQYNVILKTHVCAILLNISPKLLPTPL